MDLETDARIGSYRITRRLGRGASGVVYQAVHPEFGDVALKLLHPEVADDEGARVRFVREAETLVRLRHRNIVTIFESGVTEDAPFLSMELLAGTTLGARMASGEPMPLERKLDVAIQLCDGLQFVHDRGVIHRDVKPANVWLMSNAGVKLLDFGMARILGSTFTRAGDVIGSAAYMAPEQFGALEVDGRADIFATGAILYELLTGRRPFEADGISAVMHKILHEPPPPLSLLVPGLSRDVVLAVETALNKDLTLRYAHAADFGSDLRLARYSVEADGDRTMATQPSDAAASPAEASDAAAPTVIVVRQGPADGATLLAGADTLSEAAPTIAASEASRSGTLRSERPGLEPVSRAVSGSTSPAPAVPPSPAPVVSAASPAPAASGPPAAPVAPRVPAAPKPAKRAIPSEQPGVRQAERPVKAAPTPSTQSIGPSVGTWLQSRRWPVAAGIGVAVALVVVALAMRQPAASPVFRLDVRSVPAGASIEIDGVETGQRTPAAVTLLTRPNRLRLVAAGYQPIDADVAAASPAEPFNVSFTLRRLVRVESRPPGARILMDGRDTGLLTPADIPVDPGSAPSLQLEVGREFRGEVQMTDAAVKSGAVSVALTPLRQPSSGVELAGGNRGPVPAGGGEAVPITPPAPGGGGGRTPLVTVQVTGSYPFEITGCGRQPAPAANAHEFDVNAPCTLRLRASKYYLDETRSITASAGRIEIAAPQLARVQLRSKFEACTVILNDQAVGSPPVDLELVAGRYRTVIQCRDRNYTIPALTIEPGQSSRRLDDFLQ